ncbi:hypothetical protein K450DRAFT_230909 [Umbelopsis ramanniana AG]|uniref:BHLH domain-containing protein n=1 Tax=Umbelopsis ramanniana AG TaxID=1314678 RepID=A0AAD5EEI9_UMBRA|nr:uncharacterized protein K450DRAFT_230909 [Umbelopsis ramanniana AG]KAI8581734.1 hypothetical protein K450DRAFT_230909 [Umbelopsis ramanniana AG]
MNNAQRQQLQQQQQQQQQQFKLRNPTQYHLQMQQARSSQQGSKPGNPDYYNVDSQLWSSDFFNSLQQHQSNESPKLEDMDFGDTVNTSMVSPHSTSSPLHEFEDMNDFTVTGPSTNPSSFGTHGSFEKQPHIAMSAPANIGFAGQAFGSSYPNNTAFGSHMPSSSLRMQADDAADLAGSLDDEYSVQLNLQGMMEKRRRRRESHNAVERRRRDNINDRIHELGTLLPDLENDGINKPNKGYILRKSVEQIKTLQHEVTEYSVRVKELEKMLEQYRLAQPSNQS